MRAIEKRGEIRAARALWQKAFRSGAEVIGKISGQDVLWHEAFGIWGMFGETGGKGGQLRPWNAFGQKTNAFRSNMLVEINMPPCGIDQNLQAVFATDFRGDTWLLHQGRMSVSGCRVTEADFIAATGLEPLEIDFSDGTRGEYHPVTNLCKPPVVMQEGIAAFVAHCAHARLVKLAKGALIGDVAQAEQWERGLTPESIGPFAFGPRPAGIGSRHHGKIWWALAAELERLKVPHSNDRVAQYGPDMFTYGDGPKVLFEIKSRCDARAVFEGVGQLHIYDLLLGGGYRRVLVLPEGMKGTLGGPLVDLAVDIIEFRSEGAKIVFDRLALVRCLK